MRGGRTRTFVIAVGHDDRADNTGGNAPGGLIHILKRVVLIGILHAEGAREAVTEVMRSAGLKRLAVVHHGLDSVGVLRTGEALLRGLFALDDRDGQPFLEELRIDVQHAQGLLHCLLGGCVDGMTLLPPELTGTQERTGGLFPADDRAPLVVQLGQVTPRTDDLRVMLAEQGLGGRADTQTLLELVIAAVRYPRTLRRKALYVVGLLLEQAFRDEDRHRNVLVAGLLEHGVERVLNVLPQRLRVRAHDDAALDGRVVRHLRLFYDICVPLREIYVHRRDLTDQLFLFSHYFHLSSWIFLCFISFRFSEAEVRTAPYFSLFFTS